jgi:hypothetical protein
VIPKGTLASLVGLVLAAQASSCTGGGNRPYDATASYKCLTHRSDYRPHASGRKAPRTAFEIVGGPREQAYNPYYLFKIGPVSTIQLIFYSTNVHGATLLFFRSAAKARELRQRILARPESDSSTAQSFTLKHNVLIDTSISALTDPTRSIVLSCLQTSSKK